MAIGIKETKEFLKFVIDLVEAIDVSLQDGVISVGDAANFFTAIINAGSAFDNIGQVPAEVADLSLEEANELYSFVCEELSLSNEQAKLAVERLLEVGLKIYELVIFIKGK